MADFIEELRTIIDRKNAPFVVIEKNIVGADVQKFRAGHYLQVPNVWTLEAAYLNISTDANVGNRYIQAAVHYVHGGMETTIMALRSQAVPASTSHQLQISPIVYLNNATTSGDDDAGHNGWLLPFMGEDYLYFNIAGAKVGDTLEMRVMLKFRNWDLLMYPPYEKEEEPQKNIPLTYDVSRMLRKW